MINLSALLGVKTNILALAKFLGWDLIYELTHYTRLQTCDFLTRRLVFHLEWWDLRITLFNRMERLLTEFQCLPFPDILWSPVIYDRMMITPIQFCRRHNSLTNK